MVVTALKEIASKTTALNAKEMHKPAQDPKAVTDPKVAARKAITKTGVTGHGQTLIIQTLTIITHPQQGRNNETDL